MPFQLNSSKLFLTYPQCNLTKEYVAEQLIAKFSPTRYLVAHELHSNGDDHIHAYLELSESFRTRDSRFADISGFHGNYQGCRSSKNVLKYCSKKDDYVGNIDVASELKGSTRAADLRDVVDGKRSLYELVQEKPQYLFGLSRLEQDLQTLKRIQPNDKPDLPPFLPNPWGKVLPTTRKRKNRHFWIYSDKPNLGKSYLFAKPLFNNFRVNIKCDGEPYWTIRGDEQAVILDEYNVALFKFTQLNSMCDGNYSYRIFHGGVKVLPDPIIIVLSNQPITAIYPHMYELLYARFNEIKLD